MITLLEFPLVFFIGLVYWVLAFLSENVFIFIAFGDGVIVLIPFILKIIKFVFGKHKVKTGHKIIKHVVLALAWVLSEAVVILYFTLTNRPIG